MRAIDEIDAITLVCTDMAASCAFYRALGFGLVYGGDRASFTSFGIGSNFVNLQLRGPAQQPPGTGWGRVIFHVADPDEVHAIALANGYRSETEPADAPWGERYFHIRDPDGHELSFAVRLPRNVSGPSSGTPSPATRSDAD